MSVFGKAKFGSNKRTWFKLKDGDSTFRILPPMGDAAEDGRWSTYYKIHYGYKNSSGQMRTFESPEVRNRKTKMVDVQDAALERINALKAQLETAKASNNQELVKKLLNLVGGKKSRYNLDSNHYMNVVDLQGNIGILKIRHRAKLALDAQIKKLRDSGVEPLDPETGRFFTFSRSGNAMDTVYQVSVYKKRITIEGVGEVEQDVVHAITEDVARRCLVKNKDGSYTYKEAGQLDRLFKKPTSQEVTRIVMEGEKAVDEIFDSKSESAQEQDDSGLEGEEEAQEAFRPLIGRDSVEAAIVLEALAEIPAHSVFAVAASAATKQLAQFTPALRVTQETVTVPETVPAQQVRTAPVAPKTTAQAVSEQTDDEFLKGLGL